MKSKILFSTNPQIRKSLAKFLTFLFVFISFSMVYGQNNCPEDCSDLWTPEIQVTIAAPDHPSCELVVVYRERRCPGATSGIIREIVYWGTIGGDCNSFFSSFIPSWPNPPFNINQTALNNIFDEVTAALATRIFINQYLSLSPQDQVVYHCPNFNIAGTIEFQEHTCFSTCVSQDRNDISKWRFANIPCETEGCCATVIQHCFNPVTKHVQTQETVTATGNPPCQGPRPNCNLPTNYDLIFQSDCGIRCE